METKSARMDDNPEKVPEVITRLQNGKAEDIQTIIESIRTMNAQQRQTREICNAAIKYLNRLLKGNGDMNNEAVTRVLTLMHILGLQDGDLKYKDGLMALTRENIQRRSLQTIDDARRFADTCETVGLSGDPEMQKIAELLIINFANNQELTTKLSSLFKLSNEEREKLVKTGREHFRNLIRLNDAHS